MNGRKYYQGFTFSSDYYGSYPEITFNVENVNSIEMTIGHLDDKWDGDEKMTVYRDGEWWQDVELKEHGTLFVKKFNVSENRTLRIVLGDKSHYGFGEIKVDGKTSMAPDIPAYNNVNALLRSGYDKSCYTIYDGTNEYNYFTMNGRQYIQGFTFTSTNYGAYPEITFNVENLSKLNFAVGHLDDAGYGNTDMIVYADNIECCRIPLTTDTKIDYYSVNVAGVSTLRLRLGEKVQYGFADITFNNTYAPGKTAANYTVINPNLPTSGVILGDADGDGEVTIFDATTVQRHLAELPTSSFNEDAADADEDGEVSIFDATSIQRHLAELPTNPNIGKPKK